MFDLTNRFRSLYRTSGLTADGGMDVKFEIASLTLLSVYGATLIPSNQETVDRPSRYEALTNVVSTTLNAIGL